jgi:hypothetical protein
MNCTWVLRIQRLLCGEQNLVELELIGMIGEEMAKVEAIGWARRIAHEAGIDLCRQMDAADPEASRRRLGGRR